MPYTQEKLREAEKLLTSLEKKVYSAEGGLKKASTLSPLLDGILEDAKHLKKLSYDNEYKEIIRNQLNTKKLDEALSRILAELTSLKSSFGDFDTKQEGLYEVFSRLKSVDEYSFSSFEKASGFVAECFSHYPEKGIYLSPLYIGLLDLQDVAASLSLEKQGNSISLGNLLPAELLSKLGAKNIKSNFTLYNGSIKADFISSGRIKVTADPSKIKRIRLLYGL
jgi:hypothetical protein